MAKQRFPDDNKDVIKRYLAAGGEGSGVVLDKVQVRLLERLRYADELLRRQVFLPCRREVIANAIQAKFDVSRDTAYRDIVNAQDVFLSLTPLNKRYEIQLRIELLKDKISEMFLIGDREGALFAEKILQSYLEKYPEPVELRSPKNILFLLQQNNLTVNNMTGEEAFEKAAEVLQIMQSDDDEPAG